MRTNLVAVLVLGSDDQTSLWQGLEPVEVQTFISNSAVKTFDIGVLDWFSRPIELLNDAALMAH
jgi:hypothetical protein